MSFLNIIKRGAGAVAHGVTGAAQEVGNSMKQALTPPAPEAAAPVDEPKDRVSKGFSLPDIDPADPDKDEKQKVHDALLALDKHWSEANPEVDYEGHYRKLAAEMKAGAPKEREWNPFSKFAIALGTQDPDHPYDENMGLRKMKETSEGKLAEEKKTFEENMSLRKEALSGHIRQLLDQGNFRKALTELNAKEQMGISRNRAEHGFKMQEIEAQGNIKKETARIAAQAAMTRAENRLRYLRENAAKLKLSPSDKANMDAEYRTSASHLAETKKQYAEGMLSDEQVAQAEEEHRLEMKRIHDYYEDRELGERGPEAGPRKPAPSKGAGGMQPNAADPWFNPGGK